MKKKKEEILPEQGCGDKVAVEKETTNEVVENETVKEDASEEQQDNAEEDFPDDDEGGCIDIHTSGKDFLEFLSKLLRMMKEIVMLEKRLREFEKDPTFDLLMDLCMVHLQEMEESEKEGEPSDKNCDDDTVAEAFISMKVRKLKD